MSNFPGLISGLAARGSVLSGNPALTLATFVATLFASALLLFSVQPMFAKMALPLLGGTPAVWAVSMCFFQGVLLAGYCYAHALNRFMAPERAVLAHFLLLVMTFAALPIGVSADARPPEGDAYFWLLGVLACGVGLPFFAVSANAPLLQAWFAKTGHAQARDPYFLYAASNAGSLIALLAYPLVIEPNLGLAAQTATWSAGFQALALLLAASGAIMLASLNRQVPAAAEGVPHETQIVAPVAHSDRLTWIALAALPSGLMTAVTTHVTTDIASAPFIWVVPLALYLATFIVAFRDRMALPYGVIQGVLPVASLAVVTLPLGIWGAPLSALSFFLATVLCHRELYLRRPDAAHLTEFYIWMSAGGVIGGVFAALIAPQIFATVLEFKLLSVLCLLAIPGIVSGRDKALDLKILALGTAAIFAVSFGFTALVDAQYVDRDGVVLAGVVVAMIVGLYAIRDWTEGRALMVMTLLAWVTVFPGDRVTLHQERSFFGTNRVVISKDGQHRTMLHGTTMHGSERFRTATGAPVTAANPATYYHPDGPMAESIRLARELSGSSFSAGIVGLGTGSLACYARANEAWRFYEIDPMVARIARDPKLFTFLSRCLPNADVVFGDARLTLQKEPANKFNYLLIDAFSSDAIPAHLLTREALAMYFDKLTPGGVLAIHISNRFLDIAPVIAATVKSIPDVTGIDIFWKPTIDPPDAAASRVIVLTRRAQVQAHLNAWPGAEPLEAGATQAWTDDFSDVLSALLRQMSK